MDPRMLDYYNRELAYVREQGSSSLSSFRRWLLVWACAVLRLPTRTSNACWKALPSCRREFSSRWMPSSPVLAAPA
jgi:hypothetical protein